MDPEQNIGVSYQNSVRCDELRCVILGGAMRLSPDGRTLAGADEFGRIRVCMYDSTIVTVYGILLTHYYQGP